MDLQLFSNIVKNLLSKQDSVIINNFGVFTAEDVPAYFSERGFTINPPYRKVSFTLCNQEDDTLAAVYARSNGISIIHARVVVNDFIEALQAMVFRNKIVDLPEFGRLRVYGANKVFFIQSKDLAIFPQFDFLEPVSLRSMGTLPVATEEPAPMQRMKTMLESQAPAVFQAVESQQEEVEVPTASSEPEPIVLPGDSSEPEEVEVPTVSSEPEEVERQSKGTKWPLRLILITLLVVVLFFALLALLGRYCPEFVDPLLYNDEELEILHYRF